MGRNTRHPVVLPPVDRPLRHKDILAARTPNGSWNAAQLAAWGVDWPPRAGWKQRIIRESLLKFSEQG